MRFQITPEPTPEERAALAKAIAVLDEGSDEPSPWWQAGIREALEDEPEED